MKKWFYGFISIVFLIVLLLFNHYFVITGKDQQGNVSYAILYDDLTYKLTFTGLSKFSGTAKAEDSNGLTTYLDYKNGKRDGLKRTYYENGKLRLQAEFKNNMLNGTLTGWNKNGQKLIEIQYANDKENGEIREWYPNSNMKMQGKYIDGIKNGKFTTWDSQGEILSEEDYLIGEKR